MANEFHEEQITHQERWTWTTGDSKLLVELVCDEKNLLRINPYFLFYSTGGLGSHIKLSESDIRDILDKLKTIRENK